MTDLNRSFDIRTAQQDCTGLSGGSYHQPGKEEIWPNLQGAGGRRCGRRGSEQGLKLCQITTSRPSDPICPLLRTKCNVTLNWKKLDAQEHVLWQPHEQNMDSGVRLA